MIDLPVELLEAISQKSVSLCARIQNCCWYECKTNRLEMIRDTPQEENKKKKVSHVIWGLRKQ